MLVRNSTSLREEILKALRQEYGLTIAKYVDSIQRGQEHLHHAALDMILQDSLGGHYNSFVDLTSMVSNHPIFPVVETATIRLVHDPQEVISKELNVSSFREEDMLLYLNDTIMYNFKAPAITPAYDMYHHVGDNIIIHYGKKDGLNEIWMDIKIKPLEEKDYSIDELNFIHFIKKEIIKIKREYDHYNSIYNYFIELFTELPSLNQMYKACPTIINYVRQNTRDNLFKTVKGRNEEKLDDLKPPDAVALALARNKLRGKQ